jgi:predicted O-methyltransferase YrrM
MSRDNLSKTENYIIDNFVHEDVDLAAVREALMANNKFGINVSGAEGKFLQFLIGVSRAKTIVEIGVLYGYSTLWMAKALPEDGRIIAIERDIKNYEMAKGLIANSDVANKIELINGDAATELEKITAVPDFVFIDADKAGYARYIDWAMRSVSVGGVIVGDNTFLFGHLIGEDRGEKTSAKALESMSYFNKTLAQAQNFRSIMIPTYEGMTLAQKLY